MLFYYAMIKLNAYAKINLILAVTGRRSDGFHSIESLMQSVDLCDELIIKESERWDFRCDLSELNGPGNIVGRAATSLAASLGLKELPASVELLKKIPVGAGLAGGSADAAAALLGLNELCGLGLSTDKLAEIGATVGSDVPFCLVGGTCWVSGRGENIHRLPDMTGYMFVLGIAPFSVSTAQAYSWLDDDQQTVFDWPAAYRAAEAADWQTVTAHTNNMFCGPLFDGFPVLRAAALAAADIRVPAVLSGSGPTMIAVCSESRQVGQISEAWGSLGFRCHISRPVTLGVTKD